MRISGNPTAFVPSTTVLDNGSQRKQQALQARDCYTQNAASAQIVDAEYVEIYAPGKTAFNQERQKLDLSLAPEPAEITSTANRSQANNNRYQTPPLDTPPPGTYLSVFA